MVAKTNKYWRRKNEPKNDYYDPVAGFFKTKRKEIKPMKISGLKFETTIIHRSYDELISVEV